MDQGSSKKSGQQGGPGDQKRAPDHKGQPERENTGPDSKNPGGPQPRKPSRDIDPSTRLPQYEDTPPPEMQDKV